MTFDLTRIIESKSAMRRKLAALPIAEKLSMLDELRDRTIAVNKMVAARYAWRNAPVVSKADGKNSDDVSVA